MGFDQAGVGRMLLETVEGEGMRVGEVETGWGNWCG